MIDRLRRNVRAWWRFLVSFLVKLIARSCKTLRHQLSIISRHVPVWAKP